MLESTLTLSVLNPPPSGVLQAVSAMKASSTLDLLVRRSAGCDLFPGESSGYNSSASSVAGGDSPSWDDPVAPVAPPAPLAPHQQGGLCSRLATLREESAGSPLDRPPATHAHTHVTTTGRSALQPAAAAAR